MSNIKEIPLLFQTPMVQAVLEDRKNETRRTRDLEDINEDPDLWNLCWVDNTLLNSGKQEIYGAGFQNSSELKEVIFIKSPYGQPGDLLWVRENWQWEGDTKWTDAIPIGNFWYQANQDEIGPAKWKPSIHMPKIASRIWLMVEEIRMERLQDISEADTMAEGIEKHAIFNEYQWYLPLANGTQASTPNPIDSFSSLWISINGTESWEQNPWVWAVKFRTLSKTGKPADQVILENHQAITAK